LVKKFSQGHLKVADDARPGCPVEIATEAKTIYAAGFDALNKCIDVGGGYVEK
jgi:hypothetical protein